MSFSSSAKELLLKKRLRTDKQYMAVLCAVTASIGTITLRRGRGIGIKYTTEAHQVAKLISKCASNLFDVTSELSVHETNSGKAARSTVLSLFGKDTEKILALSGILGEEKDAAVIDDDDIKYYLRGAFLACGSVTDPSKAYHLELVCRNESAALDIIKYSGVFGIEVKYTKRKDNIIAYIKDAEQISDFLSLIGAQDQVLELANVRALKDVRNYANRTRNCDVANIEKTQTAARHQVEEIEFLLKNAPFALPEHLYETAQARLSNPDATLSELAEIMGVGKSGVNHRLARLLEMAAKLRSEL